MNTGFRGVTPFASGYPLSANSGQPGQFWFVDAAKRFSDD